MKVVYASRFQGIDQMVRDALVKKGAQVTFLSNLDAVDTAIAELGSENPKPDVLVTGFLLTSGGATASALIAAALDAKVPVVVYTSLVGDVKKQFGGRVSVIHKRTELDQVVNLVFSAAANA